jgi:hypothetical protein
VLPAEYSAITHARRKPYHPRHGRSPKVPARFDEPSERQALRAWSFPHLSMLCGILLYCSALNASRVDARARLRYKIFAHSNACRSVGRIDDPARREALMNLNARCTTWSNFSQRASVSILACTVAFLSLLPYAHALPRGVQTEERGPCQEERGTDQSETEVTASASASCVNHRRHSGTSRVHEIGNPHRRMASHLGRRVPKVGHRLANGLCLPLLV